MQERSAAKRFSPRARAALERLAFRHAEVPGRLRGRWGLHVTGGLSVDQVLQALHDDSPIVRGWAIQLACEKGLPTGKVLDALMSLSRGDDSPVVRLYISSALQRIEPEKRWDI